MRYPISTLAVILIVVLIAVSAHAREVYPEASINGPIVMLIPFQKTQDAASFAWVGQSVQEDLLAHVTRNGVYDAKVAAVPVGISDSAVALKAAHDANATYVIFGSYQVVNDQVRVDAQVGDVGTGKILGSLQATGDIRDLFKIEDSLAAQLTPMLPLTAPPAEEAQAENVTQYPPAPPQPPYSPYGYAGSYMSSAPAYTYPQYDYSGDDYPFYPYFFGSVFIGSGFHHDHFHNDGMHHSPSQPNTSFHSTNAPPPGGAHARR